jgi:hypothetical protein
MGMEAKKAEESKEGTYKGKILHRAQKGQYTYVWGVPSTVVSRRPLHPLPFPAKL